MTSSTTTTMLAQQQEQQQQEIMATISAMRQQEETAYTKRDWTQMNGATVDLECRRIMISWCFTVAQFCSVSRETVEIAIALSDRFMVFTKHDVDRATYQLVWLASLYTAAKVHEPSALAPSLVAKFSDGLFTARDVQTMEVQLLQALKWRVNPPTCASFVRSLLQLPAVQSSSSSSFCHNSNDDADDMVLELALAQTEIVMAECDSTLTVPASSIAYAAIANAWECLGLDKVGAMRQKLRQALDTATIRSATTPTPTTATHQMDSTLRHFFQTNLAATAAVFPQQHGKAAVPTPPTPAASTTTTHDHHHHPPCKKLRTISTTTANNNNNNTMCLSSSTCVARSNSRRSVMIVSP